MPRLGGGAFGFTVGGWVGCGSKVEGQRQLMAFDWGGVAMGVQVLPEWHRTEKTSPHLCRVSLIWRQLECSIMFLRTARERVGCKDTLAMLTKNDDAHLR